MVVSIGDPRVGGRGWEIGTESVEVWGVEGSRLVARARRCLSGREEEE